ncbi:hypothetical protein ACXR0O_20125 [Verrucomicrobiota bacterium sgz303538]
MRSSSVRIRTVVVTLKSVLLVVALAVLIIRMWDIASVTGRLRQGHIILVEPIWWLEHYFYGLASFYGALAGRRLLDQRWGSSGLVLVAGVAFFLVTGRIALGWPTLTFLPAHAIAALYLLSRDLIALNADDETSFPNTQRT